MWFFGFVSVNYLYLIRSIGLMLWWFCGLKSWQAVMLQVHANNEFLVKSLDSGNKLLHNMWMDGEYKSDTKIIVNSLMYFLNHFIHGIKCLKNHYMYFSHFYMNRFPYQDWNEWNITVTHNNRLINYSLIIHVSNHLKASVNTVNSKALLCVNFFHAKYNPVIIL